MGGGCCGGGGILGGGYGGGGNGSKPALLEDVGILGGGLVGGGDSLYKFMLGNLAFTTIGCLAGLGTTGVGAMSRAGGTATPPKTKAFSFGIDGTVRTEVVTFGPLG